VRLEMDMKMDDKEIEMKMAKEIETEKDRETRIKSEIDTFYTGNKRQTVIKEYIRYLGKLLKEMDALA
jgi:hypothetical protein